MAAEPRPATPPKIGPVAAVGSMKLTLEALRDRLAFAIDETRAARDVAALSRQLTDVLDRIDILERADNPVDPFEELLKWTPDGP